MANSATRTVLAKQGRDADGGQRDGGVGHRWAGSKPVASLTDGLLAGTVGGCDGSLGSCSRIVDPRLMPFACTGWSWSPC